MILRSILSVLLLSFFASPAFAQKKTSHVVKVTVKTVEGLKFSPARFKAKKGQKIELKLLNRDPNDQPHNFVLIKPGSLAAIQALSMQIGPDSAKNGFVPKSDDIIFASGLLNPEEKEEIKFDAPKEPGIYPYVCTFPGHAVVMYGAFYVDDRISTSLAFDPNVPALIRAEEMEKTKAKMAIKRPTFQRMFMPNAGPAAIAVALPDEKNVCWDAGNCRLRYAWNGGFIDATRFYQSNGNNLANLLGEEYWNSGGDEKSYGIRFGESTPTKVEYIGYGVIEGIPEFEYEVDGTSIRERITSGKGDDLNWAFKIKGAKDEVRVWAPESETATISGKSGKRDGDWWVVPAKDAAEFSLVIQTK